MTDNEKLAADIAREVMADFLGLPVEDCDAESRGALLIREGLKRYASRLTTLTPTDTAQSEAESLPTTDKERVLREQTYADWQQWRWMLASKVDWAIGEYDGFMLDDAYDAQRVLDRIIDGLRSTRAALSSSGEQDAGGVS